MSLTEQLQRFSGGDREIAEAVLRTILPELHRIAVRELRKERYIAPLQPTELIDEVWLKLQNGGWRIDHRAHFYGIAGRAMRHVLVDYARRRRAQRRGDGEIPMSLEANRSVGQAGSIDFERILEVGILMENLEEGDREAAIIVDMHYFAGYTFEELAEKTELTLRQVRHRWERGLRWLKDHL